MRKMQLFIGCDKTYAESGEYVTADETHILSLDGQIAELDLTADRAAELLDFIRPWIRAGHAPGSGPEPPEPAPKPGRGSRREIPGTRTFYAGVRAFAADQGIEIPLSGRKDGSRTKAKRTYDYPHGLIPEYVDHLRKLAAVGDGTATMQLAIAQALGLDAEDTATEASPKTAGVRAPCDRCHHPRALHGGGEGIPCKARGCNKGPDGGPCPGWMPVAIPEAPVLVPEHASS
jgi:hypothetical protein